MFKQYVFKKKFANRFLNKQCVVLTQHTMCKTIKT